MCEKVVIETFDGPVMGLSQETAMGDTMFAFHRIPYGRPPIGKLRFMDPQPADPWTEMIDGTVEGTACVARDLRLEITGSEDSLFVNVYSKNLAPDAKTPVMVWIHGGGFVQGSSTRQLYSPDYLLQKNIVLVTFNYRLGALGFLSTTDPNDRIPGNAGLKDQNLVLKWVQTNISRFGGNPNNVTLFGESAGGCSVHYHLISEMSKGLFHKAIVMSGCVLNNWSVVPERNWAERLALKLGWQPDDESMIDFLQRADAKDIISAQENLTTPEEKANCILFAFGPVVEAYRSFAVDSSTFIPESPLNMTRSAWSKHIPIMIGGTSEEGFFRYKETMTNPDILDSLKDFVNLVPIELNISRAEEECLEKGKAMKRFYFGDDSPSLNNLDQYLMLMGDKLFWHGLHRAVLSRLRHSSNANTYLYRFNLHSSKPISFYRTAMCEPTKRGACHADDLPFLFNNMLGTLVDRESVEFITMQRMVAMWTQFAITGNPNCAETQTVTWSPVQPGSQPPFACLNIGDDLQTIALPETERMRFWDSLYSSENLI